MAPARIGIVGRPTKKGNQRLQAYIEALESVALRPLSVRLLGEGEDLDAVARQLDGLLLPGGGDVHPRHYGEDLHEMTVPVPANQDDTELRLARWALEHDLPILAICRGIQVLNVAAGGTLYQHLPAQRPGEIEHHRPGGWAKKDELAHPVTLEPGSRLAALLGASEALVNTRHHQAVKDLGEGLRAVAWYNRGQRDEVIEGIEMPARRFVVGVQWHPENLLQVAPAMRGLFLAFARAAAGG